ncbi:MAG: ABC transporter permease [Bacillota bacterium]
MTNNSGGKTNPKITTDTEIKAQNQFQAKSHWQLMWQEFKNHKLAIVGIVILAFMYLGAIFAGFIAPYPAQERFAQYQNLAPQSIKIMDEDGLRSPYVYGITGERDPVTLEKIYTIDKDKKIPIDIFHRGEHTYKFWGLFETNLKLFGVEDDQVFLFGTDGLGRDIFSRTIYGSRLSLTIGLVGISVSLILGLFFGGISGYFGGVVDNIIQRGVELTLAIPKIPLWMGLGAALPDNWSVVQVYFAITVILSLTGWVVMARVVRG